MFSIFQRKANNINFDICNQKPVSAIQIDRNETILQVALRESIPFPHNCRVGACAQCKCKLVTGKIKALTETAYVLSAEEIQQGYILACQSIPKADVVVEVKKAPAEKKLKF